MALHAVLWALALPPLLASSYLLMLTALSWRRRPGPAASRRWRFEVVVPAHDEEAGIARTVHSLLALAWPAERFRVTVVADNCTDATAERAREAGAAVLVRADPANRGKGRALAWAFERLLADGAADAVVVVDADSIADPALLAAFAARLDAGALAVQSAYGVLNPRAGWRTRLMAIAFALVNDVRSLARERLGLSCGLRGNGMCITRAALARVPYDAFSVVEDVEFGIRLGEAGVRVAYAPEAAVLGDMVAGERASRSQRRRWEGGRRALMLRRAPGLLEAAVRRRSPLLLDLALDLLVPPLAWIALGALLAAAASGWHARADAGAEGPLRASLASLAFLTAYVVRGWRASGLGLDALAALPFVPVYVAWKLLLLVAAPLRGPAEFVRTAREPPRGEPPRAT